jgi:hypothetical protein
MRRYERDVQEGEDRPFMLPSRVSLEMGARLLEQHEGNDGLRWSQITPGHSPHAGVQADNLLAGIVSALSRTPHKRCFHAFHLSLSSFSLLFHRSFRSFPMSTFFPSAAGCKTKQPARLGSSKLIGDGNLLALFYKMNTTSAENRSRWAPARTCALSVANAQQCLSVACCSFVFLHSACCVVFQ